MRIYFSCVFILLTIFGYNNSMPTGCNPYFDMVLMMDDSWSIISDDPNNDKLRSWNHFKNFATDLVSLLPVGSGSRARVSTLRFSTNPNVIHYLHDYQLTSQITSTIRSMEFTGGNTNTAAAMQQVRQHVLTAQQGARQGARKIVVLITDGLLNVKASDGSTAHREAGLMRVHGVNIYTVAIGNRINMEELRNMSSQPAEQYSFHVSNAGDLNLLVDALVRRICNHPTNTTATPPFEVCDPSCSRPCEPDLSCSLCPLGKFVLDGKCGECVSQCDVCANRVECIQCIPGWYWDSLTFRCESCRVRADVAFLVDTSGSIRMSNPTDGSYDNFDLLLNFVAGVIQRLRVGSDAVRVAAVSFTSVAKLEFALDASFDSAVLQTRVRNISYGSYTTNTAEALRLTRNQVFRAGSGDRAGVQNVVVMITDGFSDVGEDTLEQARMLKQQGVIVFVVGITGQVKHDENEEIASAPVSTHYYRSANFTIIDNIIDTLVKHVCSV